MSENRAAPKISFIFNVLGLVIYQTLKRHVIENAKKLPVSPSQVAKMFKNDAQRGSISKIILPIPKFKISKNNQ